MIKKTRTYTKWLFIVGLVLSSTNLLQATTSWTGNISGTVTNDDIDIDGDCILTGNTTIVVNDGNDYTVSIPSSDKTITSTGGYYLRLNVTDGTLTFDLTGTNYNLSFIGGTGANMFNIYQTGAGQVWFIVKGGRILRFKGDPANETSGTRYFCNMEHVAVENQVGVYFQYDPDTDANENAVISLEDGSLFTFSANTVLADSDEEGGIGIYPAVSTGYSGSLLLNIQDGAGFVLTGHKRNTGTNAVDLATLAGHQVNMRIFYTTDGGDFKERFMVLNGNKVLSQLFSDPTRTRDTVTGVQHGFILGPNSELRLADGTYLDYIGTTSNIDPLASSANVLQGRTASSVLKSRNASALTIDGIDATGSVTARIVMEDECGIFLRSACDATGTWTYAPKALTDVGLVFTITPTWQPAGAGNIVFDVEAALDILGAAVDYSEADRLNVINVLSREVTQEDGKLEIDGYYTTFPAFTFAASADYPDTFAQYAKSCMFVNAQLNMKGIILRHDDFVHTVNATNTPTVSEPTYIGGDTFKLIYSDDRPTMNLFNSELRLHTSAAFTGVDLQITPTIADTELTSTIRFYGNGRKLDRGTGRALVLGTTQGSYAYDQATVVDSASYLDILQKYNTGSIDTHDLNLTVTANDHDWISQIPDGADLSGQYSVHTMFLGNESNIQIGSQSRTSPVTLATYPTLNINGNFFSFMTQGGSVGQAELSATTGEGGIFVDYNGTINLTSTSRANFGCMVVNGAFNTTITLPKSRAFFNDRVGIAYWDVDLTQTQTVVSSTQVGSSALSDFTLDWMATLKDYDGGFVPFDPTGTLQGTITHATLHKIPVVVGEVDEFQVKRSRLGDQVHLLVNGGTIRDLVFLSGYDSSEAQTGLIVVQGDGTVGIGDNSTRRDTREANVVLGINGVTLGANGNGVFNLNTDVTINNVCPILAGPDFGATEAQSLTINADDPHFIRVKSSGVLDLTSFTSTNQSLIFNGKVQLILEPGAKLVLGTNTSSDAAIYFSGESELVFDRLLDAGLSAGTDVQSTDDFRSKIVGCGNIIFDENASCRIYKDAYAGIEADSDYSTSLYIKFNDNAKAFIGDSGMYGGSLQIGNTDDQLDTTVTCTIEINGPDARIQIGSQGYLGIGAGIVDKRASAPNSWSIGSLHNVSAVSINVTEGIFQHDRIATGTSTEASLFVVGPADRYLVNFAATSHVRVLGGGNFYRLASGVTSVNPTVLTTASSTVGILGSNYLLNDYNNQAYLTVLDTDGTRTALSFFNAFRSKNVDVAQSDCMAAPRANLSTINGDDYLGYLVGTTITRTTADNILDSRGVPVPHSHALSVGAVSIAIDSSSHVINVLSDIIY